MQQNLPISALGRKATKEKNNSEVFVPAIEVEEQHKRDIYQ